MLLFSLPGHAASDLTELSLEDLMEIEVTSAAKKTQQLSETTAAMFVIGQEDIRRSGVTSIPEALRLAPGVQVARVDANKWAISIRGFNALFSDKLLVLIDGRTVYNTIFSGVFWDVQDTLIEDIDRIEIIRGPGATLWGANAVNGVINIITKNSKETQGSLISAGAGTEERGFTGMRYGGTLGTSGAFRIYAKYFNRDDGVDLHCDNAWDNWDMYRTGFRTDLEPNTAGALTFQGDIYSGTAGAQLSMPSYTTPYTQVSIHETKISGGNLLGRYTHTLSSLSEFSLQLYYDRTQRELYLGQLNRDTLDLDFQHRFSMGEYNNLIWGLGYRFIHHDLSLLHPEFVSFDHGNRSIRLFSGFLQDELNLIPEKLKLSLGSKFEHNDFSGFEIQPSARLLWTPKENQTVWAAVSRAVRTPSRANHDVNMILHVEPPQGINPFATIVRLHGNEDCESEKLLAYEIGYRTRPTKTISLDLSLFYNDYNELISSKTEPSIITPPTITVPISPDNKLDAVAYGAECVVGWKPFNRWRVQLAYSILEMDLDMDNSSNDQLPDEKDGALPEQQVSLRSMHELPHHIELDFWLRYVDSLKSLDIPDYTTLDIRLGWHPMDHLELALTGQNLFTPAHREFMDKQFNYTATKVEPSVYLKASWRF